MKKILLTLAIVSMLVCLFAISASAVLVDGIDYSFKGTEATVTANNKKCELVSVVIPSTVKSGENTYTVTSIENSAFRDNQNVVSITTPSTIKSIGAHAFRSMANLETAVINASADFKYFDNAEFYGSAALKSVDLSGCVGLIDMGNGGTYSHTFAYCSGLSSVVLPEGLEIIGPQVFKDCTSLEAIIIPSTVTRIGDYAFQGCRKLKSINFPEGLEYLGCNNLQNSVVTKVIFPSTLVTATKDMLNSVYTVETVVIANSDVSGYTNTVLSNCGPLNFVFYAGKDISVLTSKFTTLKNHTPVTYSEYLENLANPEFEGYTSKVVVYGTENCTKCGDVLNNTLSLVFTDYASKMYDAKVCSCGEKTNVKTYEPIIKLLGYSAKADENRLVVGYKIDSDSLARYEESTGKTISFGITASGVLGDCETYEPITDELTAVGNAVIAPLNREYDYTTVDFIINNFTENHYATPIVLCAYVADGSDVYYIGTGCGTSANVFTFNTTPVVGK